MEFLGANLKIESKLKDNDVEITIYLPTLSNYLYKRCRMNMELSEVRIHTELIDSYGNVKTKDLEPQLCGNGETYMMKISNFQAHFQDTRYPRNRFFELRFAATLEMEGFAITPRPQIV